MEKYSLEIKKSVEKDLKSIPVPDQIRILKKIQTLADDPRPPGSKKLSGQERYRLRQGNFRILYEIKDQKLIIVVVKVGKSAGHLSVTAAPGQKSSQPIAKR